MSELLSESDPAFSFANVDYAFNVYSRGNNTARVVLFTFGHKETEVQSSSSGIVTRGAAAGDRKRGAGWGWGQARRSPRFYVPLKITVNYLIYCINIRNAKSRVFVTRGT